MLPDESVQVDQFVNVKPVEIFDHLGSQPSPTSHPHVAHKLELSALWGFGDYWEL